MKSYQESGGTNLSTNWKDVSKGTVKVSPPEGMISVYGRDGGKEF
jgi:suppressor of G2 allele of SKP1